MEKKVPSFFAATRNTRMQIYQKQYEFGMKFPISKNRLDKIDTLQEEIFSSFSPFQPNESNQLTSIRKLFYYNGNIFFSEINYVGRF